MFKKITLLLSLLFLNIDIVSACDCIMTPIGKHINETKFIVVARVVKLLDSKKEREDNYFSVQDRSYKVAVKIETIYKGLLKHNQIIELGSEFSNCDIYFRDKEKYLLFLYKKGKKYFVKHCSYSEHIDNANGNIEHLENYFNKK